LTSGNDSDGACAQDAAGADVGDMNGWFRIATNVPPLGLIPLGLAIVAPFHRLVPVLVDAGHGARRVTGAGR